MRSWLRRCPVSPTRSQEWSSRDRDGDRDPAAASVAGSSSATTHLHHRVVGASCHPSRSRRANFALLMPIKHLHLPASKSASHRALAVPPGLFRATIRRQYGSSGGAEEGPQEKDQEDTRRRSCCISGYAE